MLFEGVNLYEYSGNNPVRFIDPDGRQKSDPDDLDASVPPAGVLQKPVSTATITIDSTDVGQHERRTRIFSLPSETVPGFSEMSFQRQETFREVYSLLREYSTLINKYANKHNVSPIAIAGAIAWEDIENWSAFTRPVASWLLLRGIILPKGRGVGLGALHVHRGWDSWEPDTVLVEGKEGLDIPPVLSVRTSSEAIYTGTSTETQAIVARVNRILDPEWNIRYIAAIMDMNARLYKDIASEDIRNRPEILTTLYQMGRGEKLANKLVSNRLAYEEGTSYIDSLRKQGFRVIDSREYPVPMPNEGMGLWTMKYKEFLMTALSK